jgi:putative membrane protein
MLRKLILATACFASTAALAAPPRSFLDDAIKGDNSEATLGRLIAAQGYSAQVRSFGSTLTRDHSRARVQAAALARAYRINPPTAMMPEARSERVKLQHLRGRAFDREVRRYMIDDHRKDIATFEAQARNGDRRTAALARAQLPTLRKHLRLAESIRA